MCLEKTCVLEHVNLMLKLKLLNSLTSCENKKNKLQKPSKIHSDH